jgi:hypothetical protein
MRPFSSIRARSGLDFKIRGYNMGMTISVFIRRGNKGYAPSICHTIRADKSLDL